MKFLARKSKIFYGYVTIVILWAVYFSNVTMLLYGGPVLNAKMVLETGMDATMVGYASSLSLVVQGMAGPLVGMVIRKRGVRIPFIAGSALLVAGAVLIFSGTVSESRYILLYGVLIGLGLGIGGILTCQSTVNLWFNQKQPFAMALLLSSGGIGGFIAPLLLNSVTDQGGWHSGWFLIACLCSFSFLLAVVFLVDRPSDIGEVPDGKKNVHNVAERNPARADRDTNKGMPIRLVYKRPAFYGILSAYSTRNAIYFTITGYLVIYLVQCGVDSAAATLAISVFSISSMLGRFAAGFIDESVLKPRISVAGCNVLMGLGVIAIHAVPFVPAIYVCTAVMGLGLGLGYVGMPLCISRYFGSDNFSMVNGVLSPFNYLMGALGPLAAAKLGNYALAFTVIGVVAILGGSAVLLTKPPVYCRQNGA